VQVVALLTRPRRQVRLVTARTITYCNRDNVDDSVVCTLLGSHGERVGVLDDDAEVPNRPLIQDARHKIWLHPESNLFLRPNFCRFCFCLQ